MSLQDPCDIFLFPASLSTRDRYAKALIGISIKSMLLIRQTYDSLRTKISRLCSKMEQEKKEASAHSKSNTF